MQLQLRSWLAAFAISGLLVAPATAAVVDYAGNTVGGPTFNRPIEDLSGLSAVGTAVTYNSYSFSVSAAGSYTLTNTARFDGFTFIYQGSFDPTAPLSNVLVGNDDLLGLTTSGMAFDLVAGVNYVVVTAGFGDTDAGFFHNAINGPGPITPVAAPAPLLDPQVLSFSGDTTGAATFNRPIEDLSALSVVGTAVHYNSFGFTVSAVGDYTFISAADFDNFLFLYDASFDPSLPLSQAMVANDDLLGLTTSGFTASLVAGHQYVLVTAGFGDTDAGAYLNTIGGPGTILPADVGNPGTVAEPDAAALLLVALAALRASRRRSAATAS